MFINNDDELTHVLSLIDSLSNKKDHTIQHEKNLYLVNAYNMEIKWLLYKCHDY
jgi:hypothetical protein